MKKRFLITLSIIVLSLSSADAQISPEIKKILDLVIQNAKHTSANSHRVIWDSVQADMFADAQHAKSVTELQPAFQTLLKALNDRQGKFVDPVNGISIASYDPRENISSTNSEFQFQIVNGDINYLKINSIPENADIQKEAMIIRAALDSLGKDESEKWVIDLRHCQSGNPLPVMAGLAPLLGEGQVCATIDGRYKVRELFEIHNGNLYDEKIQVASFRLTAPLHHQHIAVLVDNNTVATGELIAIAFKGRKNTKFFGQPTKGHVAELTSVEITKGLVMTLSKGYYQDRKGNPYTSSVKPDVTISAEENPLEQAIQWLHGEPTASIATR